MVKRNMERSLPKTIRMDVLLLLTRVGPMEVIVTIVSKLAEKTYLGDVNNLLIKGVKSSIY